MSLSRGLAGFVVVLTLGASLAAAQQRYEIKPKFQVGQQWSEQRTNTAEMTTAVKVGDQIVEQHQQKSRDVMEFEWMVLAIDGGTPQAARVKFGTGCLSEFTQDGETMSEKFPAAGSTVEARVRPDGEAEFKPASAATPPVIAVFEDLFEINAGMYPRQSLGVGESWSWSKDAVAESFGLGPEDKGQVTCTLQSISKKDGRDIGSVTIKVTYEKGEAQQGEGQRITSLANATLDGRGLMDMAAGRMTELELGGNVVVNGMLYMDDGTGNMTHQADIVGNGTIKLVSSARLAGQITGGGDKPPVTGKVDFAGEYSNPEMKLTLTRAPAGYEGQLNFGDKQFPVQARDAVTGVGLTGKFQSDEHWFDFTATLTGTTLSLTTGGKTHALEKKVEPVNPLGGGPKNPLGGDKPAGPANPLGGGTEKEQPRTPRFGNAATPHRSNATSYKTHRCLDHQGFRDPRGGPLECFRMLLPQDWQFVGGLTWKISYKNVTQMSRVDLVNPVDLAFKVVSPGERVVIQAYPEVHFADLRGSPAAEMGMFPTGSNYAGFIVCPTMDPASYITEFVIPQQRGGLNNARIIESKPLPSVVRRYDREAAIVAGALQGMGLGGVSHQAALVTVEHSIGGTVFHEAFVVVLGYLQTPGITMWSSRLNISMRAPRDEVEKWKPVIATVLNSIQFNMRWVGEYLKIKKQAEGVIIDVDRFCQKIDAEITRNRAETNAQIQRDMYPRLAPFCDHTAPDGKRYFLETDLQHQMDEHGHIRSDITLPDEEGWTRMPEYTGP